MISRFKTVAMFAAVLFAIYTVQVNRTQAIAPAAQMTIPSRTPTPGPASPTPPGAPTSVPTATPDTNPPPAATVTNPPPASATYTAVPSTNTPAATTSAATPSGGFLPTAAPCSTAPTIQIRNTTNARSGPGTDYAAVAQLAAGDVRPIVGRAASAPWWLIRLADGTQGWVADLAVQVQGYTGAVPLVTAPAINGATPTPGAAWNPTPQPGCNFTPVATASPTATAAPLTTTNQTPATTPENTVAVASASDTTSATPLPTPTTIAPPPLPGANQEIASNTAIGSSSNSNTGSDAGSGASSGASSSTGNGSRSSTVEPVNMTASSLLPIIGIVLIAAGGIGLFALRRHVRA